MEAKDIGDVLERVCDSLHDDDILLSIYRKGDDVGVLVTSGDDRDISVLLSAFIERYLNGTDDEGSYRVANIILDAVDMVAIKKISERSIRASSDFPTA